MCMGVRSLTMLECFGALILIVRVEARRPVCVQRPQVVLDAVPIRILVCLDQLDFSSKASSAIVSSVRASS